MCYVITELKFLRESMLIRQAKKKIVIFVTTGISWIQGLRFSQMSANGC